MLDLIHFALLVIMLGGCIYSFCQVILLAINTLEDYAGNEEALWKHAGSIAIQALIWLVLLLIDTQFTRMFHLS